tara:strand:+ start:160 stop:702 length:543 start_codon:yes stop_codon:yes gene_type:complete
MNKTLVYIAVGVGVLYFISRRAKKNFKKALEQTAENLGTQLQDATNNSVSDVVGEQRKKTTQSWILANKRRGGRDRMDDELLDALTKEFLKGIDDKKTLEIYDKLASQKADKFYKELESAQGREVRRQIINNMDSELNVNEITGRTNNYIKLLALMGNMSRYLVKGSLYGLPKSNFDDGL